MLKDCPVTKPCYHCSKKPNHHRSLCPQKYPPGHKEPATVATDCTTTCNNSWKTEPATLVQEDTVVMQTATVTVNNPSDDTSKETVQLLFESGS